MILRCRMKDVREKIHMTQQTLSDLSGITIGQISRIENNRLSPTVYTLWYLAEALGCLVDELYEVVEDR